MRYLQLLEEFSIDSFHLLCFIRLLRELLPKVFYVSLELLKSALLAFFVWDVQTPALILHPFLAVDDLVVIKRCCILFCFDVSLMLE